LLPPVRVAYPFPGFSASIRSSDFHVSIGIAPVAPRRGLISVRALALDRRCVRLQTPCASRSGYRAPDSIEDRVGLPGHWVICFVRAMVEHPAGCGLASPFI
jgi:hypothetical protein